MEQLIQKLKQLQANSIVLQSTAQGFHWNVEGPLFTQYHSLFKSIYEDVYSSVDTVSEWMRKLDVVAPYTLQDFTINNNYGDVNIESNSPIVMSKQLLDMIEKMISDLKMMFDDATLQKEQGLANFLADRQERLQFWAWSLRSSLKQTIN